MLLGASKMLSFGRRTTWAAASALGMLVVAACSGESGVTIPDVVTTDAGAGTLRDSGGDRAPADASPAAPADAGADAKPAPTNEEHEGEAVRHDADGRGACGFAASNDFLIVALAREQFDLGKCGSCIEVTGPRGRVTVRVVDECKNCESGDVDLSLTAFSKIADLRDESAPVTWRWTTCP